MWQALTGIGVVVLLAILLFAVACGNGEETKKSPTNTSKGVNWSMQREGMIKNQIANRGIEDKGVLEAMAKIERHRFVPDKLRKHAYEDRPLDIGERQTISQPFIVALMSQLLKVEPEHKVLEVGTGSGYQTAVLAELAEEVYSVEIKEPLGIRAKQLLKELGYSNVTISIGSGYEGWPEEAPFDRIIVTAAPDEVPPALLDQLKVGGRMVIPVGAYAEGQQLMVLVKTPEGIRKEPNIAVRFVPMTGKTPEIERPEE